ncbi:MULTISPECIES: hypothetical protein [Pseudomonas]|jgi:hypothetical protein|uniref:Uncharacterized protein n=2 Tax=Pseudomonas TaxID=286 RepID=A0A7X1GHU8_9PSED|nr:MULTISPECIES: hypothetical protein [Pseudomonas]MBC2692659.1 hypothetical protein [Pseudomonas kielensis]MDD1008376.1 hypothetical protein [Pseudomonas shahriarae]
MYQLITGDWRHTFVWEKNERLTRFVIDADSQFVVAMQVQRSEASESFREATREEMKDLQNSLVNAKGEIFERPSDFSLTECEELPSWALV